MTDALHVSERGQHICCIVAKMLITRLLFLFKPRALKDVLVVSGLV